MDPYRTTIISALEVGIARANQRGILLGPPAAPKDVTALQELVGAALPEDFCAFYLRHDGADGIGVANNEDLMPIEQITKRWHLLCDVWNELVQATNFEVDAGVGRVMWSPRWVPFVDDGGGSYLCLDLAPDVNAAGRVGQVIRYWNSEPSRPIVAPSFADWLAAVEWITPE